MSNNINTKSYWNDRFASGDWEDKNGRLQTTQFALSQIQFIGLSAQFEGTILDFGCGLGDAIPVYNKHYPKAKLLGLDHSESAISLCRMKYGEMAEFICGDVKEVPNVDVIIASNVLEHISNDEAVIASLLSKCSQLYIFVPYKKRPLCSEHVNYYDKKSYCKFAPIETLVFFTPGWTQYGYNLLVNVYLKNLVRPFFGKPRIQRNKQIMFRFNGQR